jgi:hypothetical protein
LPDFDDRPPPVVRVGAAGFALPDAHHGKVAVDGQKSPQPLRKSPNRIIESR